MAADGSYIVGAFMDIEINASQVMTVYMLGTQALVMIGGQLFKRIWDAARKQWFAGEPVEIAPPLATLDQPQSPTSAFDFEALEVASPSGDQPPIATATTTTTTTNAPDALENPRDTQTETEGKLWTVILNKKIIDEKETLLKASEDTDKYWQDKMKTEQDERTAIEHDYRNKIDNLWEALTAADK